MPARGARSPLEEDTIMGMEGIAGFHIRVPTSPRTTVRDQAVPRPPQPASRPHDPNDWPYFRNCAERARARSSGELKHDAAKRLAVVREKEILDRLRRLKLESKGQATVQHPSSPPKDRERDEASELRAELISLHHARRAQDGKVMRHPYRVVLKSHR